MSMLNWIWDVSQDSKLDHLDEEQKKLLKRIEIAEGWIRYLNERIDKLEQQQKDER